MGCTHWSCIYATLQDVIDVTNKMKKLLELYKLIRLSTMDNIGIGDRVKHPFTRETLNCVTVYDAKMQARSELIRMLCDR